MWPDVLSRLRLKVKADSTLGGLPLRLRLLQLQMAQREIATMISNPQPPATAIAATRPGVNVIPPLLVALFVAGADAAGSDATEEVSPEDKISACDATTAVVVGCAEMLDATSEVEVDEFSDELRLAADRVSLLVR